SAMGIDMADVAAVDASKAPGRRERSEIGAFHDRVLSLFNRDYLGPFHDFAFPVAWWADPRVVEIRRELAGFLKERMRESVFGFNDPRTVRLMPVWHQIFRELKLVPKIVFCLRNPAQVARIAEAEHDLRHQFKFAENLMPYRHQPHSPGIVKAKNAFPHSFFKKAGEFTSDPYDPCIG